MPFSCNYGGCMTCAAKLKTGMENSAERPR
nr:2Fe-2S iron-sulfur cluster-binding protein [Ruegeria atlantica]